MSVINYLNSVVRISAEVERCIQQHASNQDALSLTCLMCTLSLGFSAAALLQQNGRIFLAVLVPSQPVGLVNLVHT